MRINMELEKENFLEDRRYMFEAIKQAKKAEKVEDVPIGCVIVFDGQIIARGYNKRNKKKSTLCHAEIEAIGRATKKMGDWRLDNCTMYVTLEPCPMCAGAILNSRIKNVYIGTSEPRSGATGSKINLFEDYNFNHKVNYKVGILENECREMMQQFFRNLRKK